MSELIFDEIDTGISGKTAGMVADKMSAISKEHQVISITHLPQIAAMADTHFLIEKGITISTAESCTGGLQPARLIAIAAIRIRQSIFLIIFIRYFSLGCKNFITIITHN